MYEDEVLVNIMDFRIDNLETYNFRTRDDFTQYKILYKYADNIKTDLYLQLDECICDRQYIRRYDNKEDMHHHIQFNISKENHHQLQQITDKCSKLTQYRLMGGLSKESKHRYIADVKVYKENNYGSKLLYPDLSDIDPITNEPKLKPIDWSVVADKKFACIPLIKIESCVVINGVLSIVRKLDTAIVTRIIDPNLNFRQSSTLSKLFRNNSEFANKINQQMILYNRQTLSTHDDDSSIPTINDICRDYSDDKGNEPVSLDEYLSRNCEFQIPKSFSDFMNNSNPEIRRVPKIPEY